MKWKDDNFLIECKTIRDKSLDVKKECLVKITKEAFVVQKDPALFFEICGDSDPVVDEDWIAIPISVFRKLSRKSDLVEYLNTEPEWSILKEKLFKKMLEQMTEK